MGGSAIRSNRGELVSWRKGPLPAARWPSLDVNPLPYAGLITSLADEHQYGCRVEGSLPELDGILYRVGPGLYDRGPDRKRMLLDGDGMVQALRFEKGKVSYLNRFVQTDKFKKETRAGRLLYPTFSTHGSGPLRHNLGLKLANQANTSVLSWAGRLWVFDESQVPYELTLDLETIGEKAPDARNPGLKYWAHWKLDATRGVVHLLAIEQGRVAVAHIVTLGKAGEIIRRESLELPRAVYFHDWFVSENYFAFLLHPAFVSASKLLRIALGKATFSECLQWRPERGSMLFVCDRRSGDRHSYPVKPCWMWHAINAFEDGDALVCDFIGNDNGGGLGTDASPLFEIMRGKEPRLSKEPQNTVRRYVVDSARREVREHLICDDANFELPSVSATERARPYSAAYMIELERGAVFARGLRRLDASTLSTARYFFPEGHYCSEPVMLDVMEGVRSPYLITQVYASTSKKSYYALFSDDSFTTGPIAKIHLEHHAPLSFHGFWSGMPKI